MDGGDRSGYKQIAKAVDAVYIVPSTAGTGSSICSATQQWVSIEVISSKAIIKSITAAGLANASVIDTKSTFPQGAKFECSKITIIQLSTLEPLGKVIAHERVLI